MTIIYHGTSSKNIDRILNHGLKSGSYVATKRSDANFFAINKAMEVGGKAVVIQMDVKKLLKYTKRISPLSLGKKSGSQIVIKKIPNVHPQIIFIGKHEFNISDKTITVS